MQATYKSGSTYKKYQFYDLIRAFFHTQKTEDSMCFAATFSIRVYFNYSIRLSSKTLQYRHCFIESLLPLVTPWSLLTCVGLFFGENPRLSLIQHSLYVGDVEKSPPPPLTGEQMERCSRNILMMVTARVFYVLRGSLTSPFILNYSVEMAPPFNMVSHPRCCEPRNESLEKFPPLAAIEPVTVGTKCRLLNR